MPLVEHPRVDLVSFTGSAATGRAIAEAAGRRLAKTVPRARRQERARRLRRRRSRPRGRVGARARRSRTRASAAPPRAGSSSSTRVYDAFRERLVAGVDRARRRRAGDQRGEPGADPRGGRRARATAGATVLRGGERVGERGLARRADRWSRASRRTRRSRARSSSAPSPSLYRVRGFDDAVALVERLAVRPHRGDPHGERPPRDAVRRAGRRPGVVVVNAGHARQRAAHGLRRRQAVRHGLEGGRRRGARRLLRDRSTSTSSSTRG